MNRTALIVGALLAVLALPAGASCFAPQRPYCNDDTYTCRAAHERYERALDDFNACLARESERRNLDRMNEDAQRNFDRITRP